MIKYKTFKNFIKENKKLEEIFFKEQYTFFFEYNKTLYATTEENRLIFAKIKNKDKDLDWKNAKFIAYNIKEKVKGQEVIKYFSKKEIEKIKIVQPNKIKM